MRPKSEKLTFPGSDGADLAARLDLPEGPPAAYALFAHCFTCTKDIFAAARIAEGLAERGIAVLRFDFTGLGHSQGEFANTNFSSNVEDLVRAADFLRQTREAPALLIGHSLGGAAVLAAAGRIPEVKAVVTIGAPAEPEHVRAHFTDYSAEIEARGEAEVLLAGRPFRIKKQFLDDIEGFRLVERIGELKRALLVMHAPLDQTVGIDNATAIFVAAKHPKSFVSLDGADHLLTRREDAAYAAEVLTAWAGRFIGLTAPGKDDATSASEAEEGLVVVRESGVSKFTQSISAGRHALTADEPAALGGGGKGPTPYDLLLASLGACTTMTLRMYADRKKWPLARASVALRHEKIHAEDCAHCETKDGKLDRITRKIALDGDLDDEQRSRLLEIADKCPIHRTLHSEVIIETESDDTV